MTGATSTPSGHEWRVEPVAWESPHADTARRIRLEVFVEEQRFPREEEFDDIDLRAYHVVAFDSKGEAWGTGRLYSDWLDPTAGRIGRMAVRREARGRGCGRAILEHLIKVAVARGFRRIVLSAQESAIGFYAKLGFIPYGPHYLDARVPHQDMVFYPTEKHLLALSAQRG